MNNSRVDSPNVYRVSIKLNRKSDADIIERLETMQNRQGYIKEVIRQDIAHFESFSWQDPDVDALLKDCEGYIDTPVFDDDLISGDICDDPCSDEDTEGLLLP